MRHYELVAILSPMLNQDEATSTWADIKSFIGDRDGEITAEQIWGTRRLAYPIRKGSFNFLEGAYYLSSFAVENAFNKELETYLRLDERVLRSLVIRCDGPLEDRPAPGQLTAPSRYIPPGRGRRPDGGGPIPEGVSTSWKEHITSVHSSREPFNKELETYLRLDERVLRSLVIRAMARWKIDRRAN